MSKLENIQTVADLQFAKYPDGLLPTVVQDSTTGRVMMLGFANEEAVAVTATTGLATFYSRSQQKIWTKGASKSGNTLPVKQVLTDCDADTLLYLVEAGDKRACDVPEWVTCFRREVRLATGEIIEMATDVSPWSRVLLDEERMILGRQTADPDRSATARAWRDPLDRAAQKVGEEGVEVALAALLTAAGNSPEKFVNETADLLYRLQILTAKLGLTWQTIEAEIVRRRG